METSLEARNRQRSCSLVVQRRGEAHSSDYTELDQRLLHRVQQGIALDMADTAEVGHTRSEQRLARPDSLLDDSGLRMMTFENALVAGAQIATEKRQDMDTCAQ